MCHEHKLYRIVLIVLDVNECQLNTHDNTVNQILWSLFRLTTNQGQVKVHYVVSPSTIHHIKFDLYTRTKYEYSMHIYNPDRSH